MEDESAVLFWPRNLPPASERALLEEAVFAQIVEIEPSDRAERLNEICADDHNLKAEVESLIQAFDSRGDVIGRLVRGLPLAFSPFSIGTEDEPPPTPDLAGRRMDRYQIHERLGGGGMGVVYRAHDLRLDRIVALKFLPQHLLADVSAKTRFRHEARAASALDHPNICTVHDVGEGVDGQFFISMAYYSGETLKKKIARGPISTSKVIAYAVQIARGLSRAHAAGIVHRDIKPANVLVTDGGTVKILDFGVAKMSGSDLTRHGAAPGTISYMSPEQVTGTAVDHRSDIWSLGVLLCEMLTGSRPFRGSSEVALIYSILELDPDLGEIENRRLARVIKACLEKNPEDRISSANDLCSALESISAGNRIDSHILRRRWWKRTGTISSAAILLATTIGLWQWSAEDPSQHAASERAKREMLVVLPFTDIGNPSDLYFADGMADELSTRLGRIRSLGVISRNSANRYRNSTKSATEIGVELEVDYVVGGAIRWPRDSTGGMRVHIDTYLTRAEDNVELWAESYDLKLTEIFDIQSNVALQIVNRLQKTIGPVEKEMLQVKLTDNSRAYMEYLKGMEVISRTEREGADPTVLGSGDSSQTALAASHFERAVQLDEMFVEAAFRLALAAGSIVFHEYWAPKRKESRSWRDKAKNAAEHATRVAPKSRAALLAQGYYKYLVLRDYAPALSYFVRALDSGEDATVLRAIGDIQFRLGNIEFASEYLKRATDIDPQNVSLWNTLGLYHHLLRRFPQSLEARQRAVEIVGDKDDPAYCGVNGVVWTQIRVDRNTSGVRRDLARGRIPNCIIIDFHDRNFESIVDRAEAGEEIWLPILTETYRQLGLRDKERKAWTRMKETYVGDWRNSFGFLALAEAGLGNREAALSALAKFKTWMERDEGARLDNYNTFAAYVYVALGMHDELFKVLDADASGPGFMSADWLRKSWFDPVRDDPRFEDALEKFESWEIEKSQPSQSS